MGGFAPFFLFSSISLSLSDSQSKFNVPESQLFVSYISNLKGISNGYHRRCDSGCETDHPQAHAQAGNQGSHTSRPVGLQSDQERIQPEGQQTAGTRPV